MNFTRDITSDNDFDSSKLGKWLQELCVQHIRSLNVALNSSLVPFALAWESIVQSTPDLEQLTLKYYQASQSMDPDKLRSAAFYTVTNNSPAPKLHIIGAVSNLPATWERYNTELINSNWNRMKKHEVLLCADRSNPTRIYKYSDNNNNTIVILTRQIGYSLITRLAMFIPLLFDFQAFIPDTDPGKILLKFIEYADYIGDLYTFQNTLTTMLNEAPWVKAAVKQNTERRIREMLEKSYQRAITDVRSKLTNILQQWESYMNELNNLNRQQLEHESMLIGLEQKTSEAMSSFEELFSRLNSSPFVMNVVEFNNGIAVHLNVPARNVDTEPIRIQLQRGTISGTITRRFVEELFFGDRYELWLQCAVMLPIMGREFRACNTVSRNSNPLSMSPEYGLPNVHIEGFNCFGSNLQQVLTAAKEQNYLLMFDSIIASAMCINPTDSTVWNRFLGSFGDRGDDNYAAIKDKETGETQTCKQFYRYLYQQQQEEERRIRQAALEQQQRLAAEREAAEQQRAAEELAANEQMARQQAAVPTEPTVIDGNGTRGDDLPGVGDQTIGVDYGRAELPYGTEEPLPQNFTRARRQRAPRPVPVEPTDLDEQVRQVQEAGNVIQTIEVEDEDTTVPF